MSIQFIADNHTTISFEAVPGIPLYQQLYEALRHAILRGQLLPGTRLPSTRALAHELRISRATVQFVFEQLIAEGYVQGRAGSGTYVSSTFPPEGVENREIPASHSDSDHAGRMLSECGKAWLSGPFLPLPLTLPGQGYERAFRLGYPEVAAFPHKIWQRLLMRSWRQMQQPDMMMYHDAAGYMPLRQAIAGYLATARGVRCTASQVLIVSGSQQGIDLVTRVLLNPGEQIWMEDPGYIGARGAFLGGGAHLIPVPIDREGLMVHVGKERAPNARLAFVTPSHQFPMGVTMSMARRLSLLTWARAANAWILEDDYDGEFRYVGRPLAALQGLDSTNCVIYLGTMSKVLFPTLRLGYLVVPPDLVDAFVAAHLFTDIHPPLLEQITLAAFVEEGHFVRHIRRMRELYRERQATLVSLAQEVLGDALDLQSSVAGMHLMGWLPPGSDDRQIAQAAAQALVDVSPLSLFSLEANERTGILLGYTAVGAQDMCVGIGRLASILKS
jgi:GntR family transcriptional regulator / MocR family aminotransferase